jgi:hypothetical protein
MSILTRPGLKSTAYFPWPALDKEMFIEHGMRGVDCAKRPSQCGILHDCQAMKFDHIELADSFTTRAFTC